MSYKTPEGHLVTNSKLWWLCAVKNYLISVSTANKGTCWYNNVNEQRYDDLLSVSRVYNREERTYSLEIIIGRLCIAFDQLYKQ